MPFIRILVTGEETGFNALVAALEGVEGVDRVEEVNDMMPHLDDDDSSSAGLSDDLAGTDVHALEVQADKSNREDVLAQAERTAAEYGLVLEYVDDF